MKILFALVLVGLFETMVAVPKNLANPRPQSSDLNCDPKPPLPPLEEGTNEFAICEAFEIAETGDFDNSETGDGNGDELMKIFDDSYIFRANWETDRWGNMISLKKHEVQEAFDFMGDISGFNADNNEDVFVIIDSKTITTLPDGAGMEAVGDWNIKENGWKGTWKLTAKDGKITSEYVEADRETLDAILDIDMKMKRGNFA